MNVKIVLVKLIWGAAGAFVLGTAGCSKQSTGIASVAALNVVNALPTSAPLVLVQGPIAPVVGKFSGIGPLSYATSTVLTPPAGAETIYAIQKNVDTASVDSKGGNFMFSSSLSFTPGGIYSLYITGADTTSPDCVFLRDTITVRTDSTTGIRFVNLSASSGSVSIDIQGEANGSEVPALAYKSATSFKSYAATSAVSSYVFEFRDAVSGNLLATYTLSGVNTNSSSTANTVLFRNMTIALIGQPAGGTVAQSCIRVNSF